MTRDELLALLRRVLKVSPVVLGGCVDTLGLSPVECSPARVPLLRGLAPASVVTAMELRQTMERGDPRRFEVVDRVGVPCEGAADARTCEAQLAVTTEGSVSREPVGAFGLKWHVVTTHGDAVTLLDTPELFRDFLGPIDTPQEAAWRVFMEGYVPCSSTRWGPAGTRTSAGRYDVVALGGPSSGPPPPAIRRYLLRVGADGSVEAVEAQVVEAIDPTVLVGRRPAGLLDGPTRRSRDPVARHFEAAAALERAAVEAFVVMERELAAHGAPRALRQAALVAAEDERRHTRLQAGLARRFGGRPRCPDLAPRPLRDLDAIARENFVEGCVREAFGAVLALRQAATAGDAMVRGSHRAVALEEAAHAHLAWRLHDWAMRRLGRRDRASVQGLARGAVEHLKAEFSASPGARLAALAGLPDAAEAVALVEGLEAEVLRPLLR